MLGTLMKYEFKAVGRILLPLYGAWVIVAVILGLSLRSDGSSEPNDFIIGLTAVLFALVTVAAVVISAIILIQRFYKNLLGSEGYFMFALPVTTGQHLTNKIISGAVWTFLGILAAILSGMAIITSIEGIQSVFDGIRFFIGDIQIMIQRTPSSVLLIVEVFIVLMLGLAEAAAKIYAAISIGHQWGSHRVLGAILAYLGICITEGILLSIIEKAAVYFPMNWYYESSITAQSHLSMLMVLAAVSVLLAIYWFISWKLLDKRLNLE